MDISRQLDVDQLRVRRCCGKRVFVMQATNDRFHQDAASPDLDRLILRKALRYENAFGDVQPFCFDFLARLHQELAQHPV
jgi:hypothetical protein